jgi:hypothetical protein
MSNIVNLNMVRTVIVTCAVVKGLCNERTYVIDETEVATENILWDIENVTKIFLTYLK